LNFIGGGVMIWAVDIVDNYDKYMVVRSQLCKRIFFHTSRSKHMLDKDYTHRGNKMSIYMMTTRRLSPFV